MKDYLTNCPKCGKHSIMSVVKTINHSERLPQKTAKCIRCQKISRHTIIGEIVKVPSATTNNNAEFSTQNTLTIRMWK